MQYTFNFRGGKRKGAGRKNKSGLRAHTKRDRVDSKTPLHITIKLRKGQLRRGYVFKRVKHACRRLRVFAVHVIHFALLNNHMHLIVEAKDNRALASGMKSLTGTLAKRFAMRCKDRYHLNRVTSPRQMRNTYRYVLLNLAKHENLPAHIDGYSSGQAFPHWRRLIGRFPIDSHDHWPTLAAESFV